MSTLTQPDANLSRLELAAWRGLLHTHATLVKALDAELDSEHALPLTSYDVLVHLEDAPMRMRELADSVLLSRSGLTRLVDRLEREGLVERSPCEDDARGAFAALTDAGRAKLLAARPCHLQGVREHFLSHFSEAELQAMAQMWQLLPTRS